MERLGDCSSHKTSKYEMRGDVPGGEKRMWLQLWSLQRLILAFWQFLYTALPCLKIRNDYLIKNKFWRRLGNIVLKDHKILDKITVQLWSRHLMLPSRVILSFSFVTHWRQSDDKRSVLPAGSSLLPQYVNGQEQTVFFTRNQLNFCELFFLLLLHVNKHIKGRNSK